MTHKRITTADLEAAWRRFERALEQHDQDAIERAGDEMERLSNLALEQRTATGPHFITMAAGA